MTDKIKDFTYLLQPPRRYTFEQPKLKKWVEDQAVHRACKDPQPVRTTEGAEYYDWLGCINDSTIEFVIVKNQPHGWLQLPAPSVAKPLVFSTLST